MIVRALVLAAALGLGQLAVAQVTPIPSPFDSRIQTVIWHHDEIVRLRVAPKGEANIEFAQSERIVNVELGERRYWLVAVAQNGASMTVKPLEYHAISSMAVKTNLRTYRFDLEAGIGAEAVLLRFSFPETESLAVRQASPDGVADAIERYSLRGDKAVRPQWIADDGQRTFMRWSDEQAIPAVFAVDSTGREMTIDGFMRAGYYTIDRVWPQLVFRIDSIRADAFRKAAPLASGAHAKGEHHGE